MRECFEEPASAPGTALSSPRCMRHVILALLTTSPPICHRVRIIGCFKAFQQGFSQGEKITNGAFRSFKKASELLRPYPLQGYTTESPLSLITAHTYRCQVPPGIGSRLANLGGSTTAVRQTIRRTALGPFAGDPTRCLRARYRHAAAGSAP